MRAVIFLPLLLIFYFFSWTGSDIKTPLESSGFRSLSTNAEIMDFTREAAGLSDKIRVHDIAVTTGKRIIQLVEISDGSLNNHKPVVLLFAQQHGNEPSGKEGALMLIREFASGNLNHLLEKLDILIIPQVNPDGGDNNQRRTARGIDPNRDHLLLRSIEARAVQHVFNKYHPQVTVDVHEYYPFGDSWKELGYRRNFDIQLGMVTNPNIAPEISEISKEIFSDVHNAVESAGFSFFEYTLGSLPEGERLRRSTVDINDGRQSLGIQNTVSFIIEGMRGEEYMDNIEKRAVSQYATMKAILESVAAKDKKISATVAKAREALVSATSQNEEVSARVEHVKGLHPLQFPLSRFDNLKDTIFSVDEYHSRTISLLNIKKPVAYLLPVSDTLLMAMAVHHELSFEPYLPVPGDMITRYKTGDLKKEIIEELEVYHFNLQTLPVDPSSLAGKSYVKVPLAQLKSKMLVLAFEPQSTLGIVNYPEFSYLVGKGKNYPVLRLEK